MQRVDVRVGLAWSATTLGRSCADRRADRTHTHTCAQTRAWGTLFWIESTIFWVRGTLFWVDGTLFWVGAPFFGSEAHFSAPAPHTND